MSWLAEVNQEPLEEWPLAAGLCVVVKAQSVRGSLFSSLPWSLAYLQELPGEELGHIGFVSLFLYLTSMIINRTDGDLPSVSAAGLESQSKACAGLRT